MAIPQNITRNHINEVINQINNGILISWGHEVSTGQELPYNLFVSQEAVRFLTALGFEIVNI
ncbi:MAG: hypothetical protein EBR35_01580 [Flavobacteriales bacterium]|nr:hypothetical protein [Flavobacteriales bacterium]